MSLTKKLAKYSPVIAPIAAYVALGAALATDIIANPQKYAVPAKSVRVDFLPSDQRLPGQGELESLTIADIDGDGVADTTYCETFGPGCLRTTRYNRAPTKVEQEYFRQKID